MTHSYKNFTQPKRHGCTPSQHGMHKPRPKYPSVSVRETVKVSEIRDAFKNLRYKVALMSYNVYGFDGVRLAYQIDVVNCFSAPEELIIVSKPLDGEPLIFDYSYALKLYNEYVDNYTTLVKAETRDMQDMSIYADKVNYRITCPACCITCKWAQKRKTPGDHIVKVTGRLECHNPKNVSEYNFDTDSGNSKHIPERPCPPYYKPNNDFKLTLHPNVQPFGVCDNYEPRKGGYVPVPGDSIINIIDNRINTAVSAAIDDVIENNVPKIVEIEVEKVVPGIVDESISDAIDDSLDSTILPAVNEKIKEQLEENPPIIDGNRMINDYNDNDIIDPEEMVLISSEGA